MCVQVRARVRHNQHQPTQRPSYTLPRCPHTQYVLYFEGMTRNFTQAQQYCASTGQELAPYNTVDANVGDSLFAVNLLCSKTAKTTCWVQEPGVGSLYPIISQEGTVHYQDGWQEVAFVCRSMLASSNSTASPTLEPESDCAPLAVDYQVGDDLRGYTLYSGPGCSRRSHRAALDYCDGLGQELANYWLPDGTHPSPAYSPALDYPGAAGYPGSSYAVVRVLCTKWERTCWLHMQSLDGLAPMISKEGEFFYQGADQKLSWVCRTKDAIATVAPVAPTPAPVPNLKSVPVPAPTPEVATSRNYTADDGRRYTLFDGDAPNRQNYTDAAQFCAALEGKAGTSGQWELAFYDFPGSSSYPISSNAVKLLCGGYKTTCWVQGPPAPQSEGGMDVCPMVSQEVAGYYQACTQTLNFVCRSPPTFAPTRRGRTGLRRAM